MRLVQYYSACPLWLLCLFLVFLYMQGIGNQKTWCYLHAPQAAGYKLVWLFPSMPFPLNLKMVQAALLCFATVATPKQDPWDGSWSSRSWSSPWLSWRGRKYVNKCIVCCCCLMDRVSGIKYELFSKLWIWFWHPSLHKVAQEVSGRISVQKGASQYEPRLQIFLCKLHLSSLRVHIQDQNLVLGKIHLVKEHMSLHSNAIVKL